MTNAEIGDIKDKVNTLSRAKEEDAPEYLTLVQDIVCPFYQGGDYFLCRNCNQPDEQLAICGECYVAQQNKEKALVWSTELQGAKKRAKVKLHTVEVGLQCNTCYVSKSCPLFEAGSACGIDWNPDVPREGSSLLDYLIEIQLQRVEKAKTIELIDGGVMDPILSGEMDRLTGLVATKKNLATSRFSMNIESSGNSPQGESILSKIFGAALAPAKQNTIEEAQVIELEAEPIKLETKEK